MANYSTDDELDKDLKGPKGYYRGGGDGPVDMKTADSAMAALDEPAGSKMLGAGRDAWRAEDARLSAAGDRVIAQRTAVPDPSAVRKNNQRKINQVSPYMDDPAIASVTKDASAPSRMSADGAYNDMTFGSRMRRTYQRDADGHKAGDQVWFDVNADGSTVERREAPDSEKAAQNGGMWSKVVGDREADLWRQRNLMELQSKRRQLQMRAAPKVEMGNLMQMAYAGLRGGYARDVEDRNGNRYKQYDLSDESLSGVNDKLMKIGVRNSVKGVTATVMVDKGGNPIGEVRFDILRQKDGNVNDKGETLHDTRSLSEAQDLFVRGLVDSGTISGNPAEVMSAARNRAVAAFGGGNPSDWTVGRSELANETVRTKNANDTVEAQAKKTAADAQMKEAQAKADAVGAGLAAGGTRRGGVSTVSPAFKFDKDQAAFVKERYEQLSSIKDPTPQQKSDLQMMEGVMRFFSMVNTPQQFDAQAGGAVQPSDAAARIAAGTSAQNGNAAPAQSAEPARKPLNAAANANRMSESVRKAEAAGFARNEGESDQNYVSRYLRQKGKAPAGGKNESSPASAVDDEHRSYIKGKTVQDIATQVIRRMVRDEGLNILGRDNRINSELSERDARRIVGHVKSILGKSGISDDWMLKNIDGWSPDGELSYIDKVRRLVGDFNADDSDVYIKKGSKGDAFIRKAMRKYDRRNAPIIFNGRAGVDDIIDRDMNEYESRMDNR